MKRSTNTEYHAVTDDGLFLDDLRSSGLPRLLKLLQNHSHKRAPLWKKAAIRRAIAKLDPKPLQWVLGLDDLKRMRPHMDPQDQLILDQTIQRISGSSI